MNNRRVLFTVLAIVGGNAAAAEVSSRIDSVVVYPDGARVTRVATVNLSGGINEVVFSGLTSQFVSDGLQVEVNANDVEIGQVRVEQVQERDAYNAGIRRLQADIEEVRSQITQIEDSTKTAQLRLKFLDGIAQGYAKQAWFQGAQGSVDIASWQEALSVLDSGADAGHEQIRKDERARKAAQKELSLLDRQLSELRGGSLASSEVKLMLASERAQTAEVRLHYFQAGAHWTPVYEVRLDSDSGQLRLAQRAEVSQSTDEAWSGVRLTLSTSEPTGNLAPCGRSSQSHERW